MQEIIFPEGNVAALLRSKIACETQINRFFKVIDRLIVCLIRVRENFLSEDQFNMFLFIFMPYFLFYKIGHGGVTQEIMKLW